MADNWMRQMRFNSIDHDYLHGVADLARRLHLGQERKFNGGPYWNHLFGVARLVYLNGGTVDQVAAAFLHDSIEDVEGVTAEQLVKWEVRPSTVEIVVLVTRRPGEPYSKSIDRAAYDLRSNLLKQCDTVHNISTLPQGHPLWRRYINNLDVLNKAWIELTGDEQMARVHL